MSKDKITVTLKLDHIISDRNQYKPYIAQLSGEDIYVEVDIDLDGVRHASSRGKTVLTVDGLAAVLGNVAEALEKMHRASLKKAHGF